MLYFFIANAPFRISHAVSTANDGTPPGFNLQWNQIPCGQQTTSQTLYADYGA